MTDKATRVRKFNMDVAIRCSHESHARKRKTGCVIVNGNTIISHGWNGMPSGYSNECETSVKPREMAFGSPPTLLETKPEVLHAEENAIGKVAASTQSTQGADLYVTYAPCTRCARLIWRAEIRNVYYLDAYEGENVAEKNGLLLLEQVGIPAIQIRPDGSLVRATRWDLASVD